MLHIDLIYQPPQPKDMKKDIMLTTCERERKRKRALVSINRVDWAYIYIFRLNILFPSSLAVQIPKELKYVPFSKPYKAPPPAPDFERTPEIIEAEMKALEAAMEALALVTLKCVVFLSDARDFLFNKIIRN